MAHKKDMATKEQIAAFNANLKKSSENRDKSQDWANKSEAEKEAIYQSNIKYNQMIANMSVKEHAIYIINLYEKGLETATNPSLIQAFKIRIETYKEILASQK